MTDCATQPLPDSWQARLEGELKAPYMQKLKQFLRREKDEKKIIFPPSKLIFNAFWLTPFDKVRVVILGQDPYHGVGQAHGLCFSVPDGVPFPPSLNNIFNELKSDLNLPIPKSGNLTHWAEQGVLLLNSVLTVEAHNAASHEKQGWEQFTDKVIEVLNREKEHIVFVLWGSYAQKKGAIIDKAKHHVITCVHPSPLSAYRGFIGSRPFSKINAYLALKGQPPIKW